ncbi:hypothetical protein GYH30_012953 [Glycine max]|uniref:Uncharacterized protein n=1 Tax=Glycine max TaxID=3847 RepID=K7KQS5_SOYBN|nr:hypothetical protein GYH30_012953 [Glycine max]
MPDKEALTTNYRHHTDSQPAWATRAVEQGGMSRLNYKRYQDSERWRLLDQFILDSNPNQSTLLVLKPPLPLPTLVLRPLLLFTTFLYNPPLLSWILMIGSQDLRKIILKKSY